MKKKIWKVIVLLVTSTMFFAACAPVSGDPAPAPEASAPADVAPDVQIAPEEELTSILEEPTLEWLKNYSENSDQSWVIAGVDVANPWGVIVVGAGVVLYTITTEPEVVEGTAIAVVNGIEGIQAWVRENLSVSVPSMFKPEGGELSLKMPGISFSATWEAAEYGCDYKGFLNNIPLVPFPGPDPCNPEDFMSWLVSQLADFQKHLGERRAMEFIRAITELIAPFMP
ncbi:MAG: hypothetical protein UV73_C0018G0023 [Candidatus Gottesmanbacteria bacterium GW2011_GWA2_43_14]|uniref:Uncharacterized protein n=1 Tax=Candidatus Gottesmanbacteria bacterium GW2011_GWA2_43_14 TaxID=1618443 RepID=A0A0G1DBZ2_9BACT|nr:MAG: hypothetical protein UV73_C0018G0023 [Candidatus Gottesmanbacteria bacterium GW2011_GWA2_43_14]